VSNKYMTRSDVNNKKEKLVPKYDKCIKCGEEDVENLTFRGPCIVMYSYNESQWDELFLKFDKVLYMFRTGPLSIIRSISTLYTDNRYLSC